MATIFTDVANHTAGGCCLRCGAKDVPTLDVTSVCGRMQGFPLCAACMYTAAEAFDHVANPGIRNGAKSQGKSRGKTQSRQTATTGQCDRPDADSQDIPVAGIAAAADQTLFDTHAYSHGDSTAAK